MIGNKIGKLAYDVVAGIMLMLGYKLKVTVGEHKIYLDWVKASNLKERAWDKSHYVNGNIFVKGYANPIKPRLDREKSNLDMIESTRYKDFMKLQTIQNIAKLSSGKTGGVSIKLLAVLIIFQTCVVLLILLGMFGVL